MQLPLYLQPTEFKNEPGKITLTSVAEIELSYKRKVNSSKLIKIETAEDSYKILKQIWDHTKLDFVEQFKVLLVNRANKVIGSVLIGTGGTAGCVVEPKTIFVAAIKTSSSGIIISHNHPSGNLLPSKADIELTKRIKKAGEILDIKLLDHIIISDSGYYSFANEGEL